MRIILFAVFLATIFVFGVAQEKPKTLAASSTASALTTPLPGKSGAATLAPVATDQFLAMPISVNSKIRTEDASKPDLAQDQVTEDDLDALLDKVSEASVELKKADEKREELATQIIDFAGRRRTHEANRCIRPEGRLDICAAYDQKAAELDRERIGLAAARDENVAQIGILKSNFGMLKARIRIMTLLLYDCDCDGDLGPEAATECWSVCVDNKDPGLRSCLDMSPSAVAACLDKLRQPDQ